MFRYRSDNCLNRKWEPMIYFIADTHFNHANIIKYCKTPLTNTDEMNKYIIIKQNIYK